MRWPARWPVAQPSRRWWQRSPQSLPRGLRRRDHRLGRERRPRDDSAELEAIEDHGFLDELDRAYLQRMRPVHPGAGRVTQLRILGDRSSLCGRPSRVLLERPTDPGHERVGAVGIGVQVGDVGRPRQRPQGWLPIDPRALSRLRTRLTARFRVHQVLRSPEAAGVRTPRLTPTPLHSRCGSRSYLPTISSFLPTFGNQAPPAGDRLTSPPGNHPARPARLSPSTAPFGVVHSAQPTPPARGPCPGNVGHDSSFYSTRE